MSNLNMNDYLCFASIVVDWDIIIRFVKLKC